MTHGFFLIPMLSHLRAQSHGGCGGRACSPVTKCLAEGTSGRKQLFWAIVPEGFIPSQERRGGAGWSSLHPQQLEREAELGKLRFPGIWGIEKEIWHQGAGSNQRTIKALYLNIFRLFDHKLHLIYVEKPQWALLMSGKDISLAYFKVIG